MGTDGEADRRGASNGSSGERRDPRESEGSDRASGEAAGREASNGSSGERRDPRESEGSDRASGEAASREAERSESSGDGRVFPGVPDSNADAGAVRFPAAGSGGARTRAGTDHAREGAIEVGDDAGGDCSPDACTCGARTDAGADGRSKPVATDGGERTDGEREQSERDPHRDAKRSDGGSRSASGLRADGAGVANVDEDGQLGDLEFTTPAEGVSQDVYADDPTHRVGVPDGVDLETPDYSIRSEMNDIETPDSKTWFHELDEAVIQDGRCIQCGTCVAACPSDSIGVGEDDHPKLVKMCTGCSLCWEFCPRGGLRYERQWVVTGGEDNVKGAGDPITEFSARVDEDWTDGAQDGGVVTHLLATLLEAGEIDGALIATEDDEEPWKAVSYLATSREDLIENAGTIYNQTLAVGNLDLAQWAHKLPDKPREDLSLAFVGTPCEIEGLRALQDFDWDHDSHEAGVRAVDYVISLMCTKNFNYYSLVGEQLGEQRGIDPAEIAKLDVLHGKLMVYGHDGEMIVEEDITNFHDAALKGCDECADFTGFCSDVTVGSVGSSDEYSSVIIRTEQGMTAWELAEPTLDYHDLEDRSAVGKLQGWDKKKAFESLERPFDPDAPRFIEYADHADRYGTAVNPHDGQ